MSHTHLLQDVSSVELIVDFPRFVLLAAEFQYSSLGDRLLGRKAFFRQILKNMKKKNNDGWMKSKERKKEKIRTHTRERESNETILY